MMVVVGTTFCGVIQLWTRMPTEMVGTFACPECFSEVAPNGATPGRRVRCQGCGTLVEVPFLIRAVGKPRSRKRPTSVWIWMGLGLTTILLLIAAATRFVRAVSGQNRDQEISRHLELANQADQSGELDRALSEVETALRLTPKEALAGCHDLCKLRDKLSVRVAEARLVDSAAERTPAEMIEADQMLPSLRALKDRAAADPALEPLQDRIDEGLTRFATRQAETLLAVAATELAAERPDAAIKLCEHAAGNAEGLRSKDAEPIREKAQTAMESVVARFGVVIDPIRGEFLQGPSSGLAHSVSLEKGIAEALRRHQFVPKPENSRFAALWDQSASFHLAIQMTERYDGFYFLTPLRTCALTAQITLKREGVTLWQGRASGKTRVPPPKMSAYEASHLATVKTRDPALEKRFYDDARVVLGDGITAALRNLPSP